ncbi:uncharacterized [Tachysurus ichikawai]
MQLRTSFAHVRGFDSYSAKATSFEGLRASITLHLPGFLQKNAVIADQKTGLLHYPINVYTLTIYTEQSGDGPRRNNKKRHYVVCDRDGN